MTSVSFGHQVLVEDFLETHQTLVSLCGTTDQKSSSWYIQDKIEYSDIVINLGIRYDRLDPNSTYPDPTKELGYQYTDASGISQIITPSSLNLLSEKEKETLSWGYIQRNENGDMAGFMDAPRAPAKDQWSPRLGVGYPITDRTAFHFSYGQFYQFPFGEYVQLLNYQGEDIALVGLKKLMI